MSGELTVSEQRNFASLEETIQRGLATFIEVGNALAAIRDGRLYRQDFTTFEGYCRERWGFSDRRARQLIEGAEVGTMVPIQNERQARELAPLADDEWEVIAAWREGREMAEAEGVWLSAKIIRNAVQKRLARIKREKESEERRQQVIEPVVVTGNVETFHGDFRQQLTGVDLAGGIVVTDPPYPREFLSEWEAMGKLTAEQGCEVMVAMCGQSIMVEALDAIQRGGWTYRWCGAYLTIGPATRVWGANVGTSWKPILVFDRVDERRFLTTDLFRSTGDDKQHHYWGQNENGIAALVEAFSEPGDLVVDPFMGGGTTAIVCRALGRRFIGCDVDGAAVEATRERLAA